MNYVINLTASNFSRQLDEVAALNLASVSGLFASFKYQNSSFTSEQTIRNFQIDKPFSWQSIDLFLGLFSGFGRCLIWEIDNIVEFVQICDYFMVNEPIRQTQSSDRRFPNLFLRFPHCIARFRNYIRRLRKRRLRNRSDRQHKKKVLNTHLGWE